MKSLLKQKNKFSDISYQLQVLNEGVEKQGLPHFSSKLQESGMFPLRPVGLDVFQINMGKMCNQVCAHCHVDAGPDRKEIMTKETLEQCLIAIGDSAIKTVDLTGGAPEMNPHFYYCVAEARKLGLKIIDTKKNWTSQVPSIISLLTLSVFVFMLSSKFGILALIINFILLLIYYVKQSKRLMFALVVFGVFGALSVLIISQTPLKKRFSSAYTAMVSPSDKPSSTRARIDVWSVTVELIEENPVWGVGAGDIRNQLMTKYENKGFDLYQKKGYDSHQEFLQTYAALGILGLLTMIGMFLILFLKAFQTGNFLLFIFSFLLLMFGMVESMLERQAGVVFFVFFGLYFFSYNPIKKEK